MIRSASSRIGVLIGVVPAPERLRLAAGSLIQLVERLVVVAIALRVLRGDAPTAAALSGGLAGAFLVRAVLLAGARVRFRSALLRALAEALLTLPGEVEEPTTEETEFALNEGLFAADEVIVDQVPRVAGDVLATVVLFIVLAWIEPVRLLLEGGAVVAAGAAMTVLGRRVAARSGESSFKSLLPALEDFSTVVRARVEILANGSRTVVLARLVAKLDVWRRTAATSGKLAFLAGRAPMLGAGIIVGLICISRGGWERAALGQAAVLASATPALFGVARGAVDLARVLARAAPVIHRLGHPSTVAKRGPAAPEWSASDLACEGVSFRFPRAADFAVRDVSLTWAKGQVLALAGRNGSGKTTLLMLLVGLFPPTDGRIAVDGAPTDIVDGGALRADVAYLTQRPFLPDRMTVADAIALLAPNATAAEIQTTLTRLALWPVLARRNPGAPLEVKLGALSAGEKQRVAIARVLLRDAKLLVLDEPDANLDAAGVAILASVLREQVKDRMVIFAAHDEALLASADRVIRFEGGKVVAI